jgi:hypothetical protein
MARTKQSARKSYGSSFPSKHTSKSEKEKQNYLSVVERQRQEESKKHDLDVDRRRQEAAERQIKIDIEKQAQIQFDYQHVPKQLTGTEDTQQFLFVQVEVPKFWRGNRLFFSPGRLKLVWCDNITMVFKPLLPGCEYFVSVCEKQEPMPFSDQRTWFQPAQKPSRREIYFSPEAIIAVKEFSLVEQVLTLQIQIPTDLRNSSWFRNPLSITLRYPGVTRPDIKVHYSELHHSTSELHSVIRFELTELERIVYSDGCDVFPEN